MYKQKTVLLERAESSVVSVEDIIANMRIVNNAEYSVIESKLNAAIEYIASKAGIRLNTEKYRLNVPVLPGKVICFKHKNIKSIDSISYVGLSDAYTSLDVDDFYLSEGDFRASLTPKEGFDWPEIRLHPESLRIDYTVGFVAPNQPPETLKQAVVLLASHWVDNRTAASMHMESIPFGVDDLISSEKRSWF